MYEVSELTSWIHAARRKLGVTQADLAALGAAAAACEVDDPVLLDLFDDQPRRPVTPDAHRRVWEAYP